MRISSPALLLASTLCMCTLGCRRQRAPDVPDVWDENAAPERTEALGNLAPPWPAPAQAQLEDGLLTFWLHEADTPALHVRLMFPVADDDELSPELIAVSIESLRAELRRRLARYNVEVAIDHRPGRVELSLHARGEDSARVFSWLARILGRPDPEASLVAARDRLRGRTNPPTTEEVAASSLVHLLMSFPAGPERLNPAALGGLSASSLEDGWFRFTDPRRAVLVVHAGQPAPDARASLAGLSKRWQGKGRRRTVSSALARLRPLLESGREAGKSGKKNPAQNLLSDASAPILNVATPGQGGPVMVLGRTIPTPTERERTLARLAQRVAQEELDVRLSISGDSAVVAVVVQLSGRAADGSVQQAVEDLSRLASARQPRQRLFQAAQLWLGARVVEASLRGEDWTALWSQAIDLANDDADIGTALAKDAKLMLGVEPDDLLEWQKAWLDPRNGKPGWHWVVSGVDRKIERQLSRLAQVQPLSE